MNRRGFIAAVAGVSLAGCTENTMPQQTQRANESGEWPPSVRERYPNRESIGGMATYGRVLNWITASQLERQTELIEEQNELLREIRDAVSN